MIPADADRWQRMEELFLAAVELPPAERDAFLDEHCVDDDLRRQVEAMIAADADSSNRFEEAVQAATETLPDPDESQAGRQIGPYVLVRELGRGGMGTVYHAIRSDGGFFQAVAIKLIKRGMDSDAIIRRFRQERHILARLDHPNVARLLDGGTTSDGQPYLVMDYVEGVPLNRYRSDHKLDLRSTLDLFLGVCEGVQAAHNNRVVHRDLKPANILVSAGGRPRLLDFGIAKCLDADNRPETVVDTIPGLRMFTPDYASPEQVRGERITESADIYALGAILFELLTGGPPHRFDDYSPAAMARVICETELRRPSEVAGRREWKGDLDAIILRAMHRDPGHRYPSVEALAADIRSYLDGRPTVAGRAKRITIRKRIAIAVFTAALLGLIVWAFALGVRNAAQVKSIAVLPFVNLGMNASEDALADGLTEDLITELANAGTLKIPSRTVVWQYKGKTFDVREAGRAMAVDAVIEGSVRRSGDDVRIVAQLISVRDGFHLWAQDYDRRAGDALTLQKGIARLIASELRNRLIGRQQTAMAGRAPPDSAATHDYLEGYRLFNHSAIQSQWTEGTPPRLQAAIDAFENATRRAPEFAAAWASLGEVLEWAITFDDRRRPEYRSRSEAAARKALALEPTNSLALATLGAIHFYQDWDLRKAEQFFRRAVETNPRSTGLQSDYADLLMARGHVKEAEEALVRAQLLEPGAARLAGRRATVLAWTGRCAEAKTAADLALSLSPDYRHSLWALAVCAEQDGRLADAEQMYRKLIAANPVEQRSAAALGYLLAKTNRGGEARKLAQDLESMIAKGRRREVFAALVHTGLGEHDAALDLLDRAWDTRDGNLLFIQYEQRFQALHSKPRFRRLQTRLNALR